MLTWRWMVYHVQSQPFFSLFLKDEYYVNNSATRASGLRLQGVFWLNNSIFSRSSYLFCSIIQRMISESENFRNKKSLFDLLQPLVYTFKLIRLYYVFLYPCFPPCWPFSFLPFRHFAHFPYLEHNFFIPFSPGKLVLVLNDAVQTDLRTVLTCEVLRVGACLTGTCIPSLVPAK